MQAAIDDFTRIVFIGLGATALMDAWLWLLGRLGIPTMNFALLGRWVGHVARGGWSHQAIGKAPAIPRENALGWLTHYAVGIAFAGLLVAACGLQWTRQPTWPPALAFGLATVLVPLLVVQPAMGLGFASSKTSTPARNTARSVANHAVFGAGLYVAASAVQRIAG